MQPGTVVGAYRIANKIGAGGMGQVFIAEHTMLGRRAALKVLHPEMSAREDIVRRFFNEARAATAIPDPGIVQIFDFGYSEDGAAYIVMELLDGETLEARVQRGRLELRQALRLMRQTASTLGAAHARGIVHRDLKPDNIFIMKDPEVAGGERAKILDFGIAKLSDDRRTAAFYIADALAPRSSQGSGVLGTPLYMSPEQCRGQTVDARSDVYAMGCVLYQIVTGQYAFDADTAEMLVFKHCEGPIPMPSMAAPNIPVAIDDIVRRCLAKRPEDRYRSGTELAFALADTMNATPEPGYPRADSNPAIPSTLRGLGSQPSIEELPTMHMMAGVAAPGMAPTIPGHVEPVAGFEKKVTTLSRATGSSSVGQPPRPRSLAIVLASAAAAVAIGVVGWRIATTGPRTESSAASAPAETSPDPIPSTTPTPDPTPTPTPDPTPTVGAEPAKTAETTPIADTTPTTDTPATDMPPATDTIPTTDSTTETVTAKKDVATAAKKTTVTSKTTKHVVKKKQQPPDKSGTKTGTKSGSETGGILLDANGIPVHR